MCPCPTLQVRGCPPPSHGRGQDGSLLLLLYDSFIHSFTPVYPDAIQVASLPHLGSAEFLDIRSSETRLDAWACATATIIVLGRVDEPDGGDAIRRNAEPPRVLPDGFLVRSKIQTTIHGPKAAIY